MTIPALPETPSPPMTKTSRRVLIAGAVVVALVAGGIAAFASYSSDATS